MLLTVSSYVFVVVQFVRLREDRRGTKARGYSGLDISSEGDEAAVFAQYSAHGDNQGFDLQFHRGVMRGFEDDFEWDRIDAGWSGENTLVLFVDDSVARGETVNDCVDIARQNFAGSGQRRAKQIFGQSVAANKAVKTFAGIVSMQLDDAVEMAGAKFVLENFNFG